MAARKGGNVIIDWESFVHMSVLFIKNIHGNKEQKYIIVICNAISRIICTYRLDNVNANKEQVDMLIIHWGM